MVGQILIPERITATIGVLRQRILERFPQSSLATVCQQLLEIAEQSTRRSIWISRPIWWIRISGFLLILLILGTLIAIPVSMGWRADAEWSFAEFVQVSEAGLNEIVILGALIFFLARLETRIKRNRALQAVHELRSIAHIIDLHQLTKDPERLLLTNQFGLGVSPKLDMTVFQLKRYLDYCSEMLSLVGKIAALYVQRFDDAVTIQSVNDVESLTTGLSRKIWQKIMILHEFELAQPPPKAADPPPQVPAAPPPAN
jgi:hypothetical protein